MTAAESNFLCGLCVAGVRRNTAASLTIFVRRTKRRKRPIQTGACTRFTYSPRTRTMTNRKNFYIYVDSDGNMPVLSYRKRAVPNRPYYTRYINEKPVAYHGPIESVRRDISKTRTWDYSQNEFVPIETLVAE